MRDPDHRPEDHRIRPGDGGKALERLRVFQQARGITDDNASEFAAEYTAGVAQAIALQAMPPAPSPSGSEAAPAAPPAPAGQPGAAAAPGGPALPQWHFLGPELMPNGQTYGAARVPVSGRVGAIAVDPSNAVHLLCGSAGGGIWESFTHGADWAPRTDSMPTLTIGAVTFDPKNPATVYAGTGEGNFYSWLGQGILRSTDGGTTWAVLAANPFVGQGFFRIIVDPANGQHILAATSGGVYESTDGGVTWSQRHAAQTWEISMQPAGGGTAEVLAAAADGLQRSTDGGHTWAAQALPGAPGAAWTRLAVSIAPSDGSTAFVFGAAGGVAYLWRRSGGAWAAMGLPGGMNINQAWYDWYVGAAIDRADQVYLGAIDVYRGDLAQGVWTWTDISTKPAGDSIHPDQHAITIDPGNASKIYCGSDGGLFRSPDRGVSWVPLNCGLGITEVEYMANNNANPLWLLAGTQDNGSIRYLGTTAFEHVADGDGGDCGVDQTNPATCFHSYYNMGMERSTAGGAWQTFAGVGPNVPPGYSSLFYPPMAVNGSTVAQAGQSVFISRDHGTTWTEVLLPGGLTTTALAAPTGDLLYAATNAGRIFKTTYAGGAWAAPAELTSPRGAYISAIVVDPSNSNRLWVTMSQLGGGRVFRSDDGGTTWNDQTAGLPGLPINSVAVDNTNSARVWVSADVGVYQTTDTGATWSAFYQNLPNMLVEDLEFHPAARVLRAATRNRGVWEVAVDQPGSNVLPQGLKIGVALLNTDATLQVFAVQNDKSLGFIRQTPSTASGWTGWTSLGGVCTSALAGVVNQDGRLEVFVRGTDGAIYHNWQNTPGGGWSGWASLGGFSTGDPAAAVNTDGRPEVFARGTDGSLAHSVVVPNVGWSAWASLGGVLTTAAAIGQNADGRLEAFARGNDGSLIHSYQTTPGSGTWSGWSSLGGVITSMPAVGRNADGRLEVFARGTDGALYHIYQTAPNSGWSGWASLGGVIYSNPAVTSNQDGRLEAFAQGTDGALWHIYQTAPNSGWSGWASFGGVILTDAVATRNQDGRLEAFAQGTDNGLWHVFQTAPNSGWSGWSPLGGALIGFA